MKVAVIEDSAVVARFFEKYLRDTEYEYRIFGSQTENIDRLLDFKADVVICPGFPTHQSGPAIVSTIKADPRPDLVSFIVSTSLETTDLSSEWDFEAIDGILIKPFQREKLVEALDRIAARKSSLSRDQNLVVVVDDSRTVRIVLESELTSLGFKVALAQDGKEGLDLIEKLLPDLVLTDIEMPIRNGLEMTSDLAANPRTAHIPVIVISTLVNDEQVRRWFKFGASRFLQKPVDTAELAQTIADVLGASNVVPLGTALVLEHEATTASIIQRELSKIGVRSNLCRSQTDLDAFLAVCRPDLITLDLSTPDDRGLALCNALRNREDLNSATIIVLADENGRAAVVQSLNQGANDFLIKPFTHEEFKARVQNHLRTKRLHDELAQRNRMLETLAYRDGLTGLLNRRYMDEALVRELERTRAKGSSLGLIMIDLDRFKKVNDTYGHHVGDEILQEVAMEIQNAVGQLGIPCRYGGEEMCVFLPDTALAKAKEIAERIRSACDRKNFTQRNIKQTLSLGVSAFPKHSSRESLVNDADQALYQAKAGGRNRVVAWLGPQT